MRAMITFAYLHLFFAAHIKDNDLNNESCCEYSALEIKIIYFLIGASIVKYVVWWLTIRKTTTKISTVVKQAAFILKKSKMISVSVMFILYHVIS